MLPLIEGSFTTKLQRLSCKITVKCEALVSKDVELGRKASRNNEFISACELLCKLPSALDEAVAVEPQFIPLFTLYKPGRLGARNP